MIQQKEFYNKYWINRNNETNQPDIGWIYEKQRIDSYLLKIVMASINNSFNLLEIGLGKGDLAFKICQQTSQYSDMKYFGIDLSEDGVRIAQERVDQRFSFSVGDATHLNFESKRFDMVICSEVIEHIVDKSKIISEIKRVLKTDGTLLLTTPNPQALTYALPKFLNLFHKYHYGSNQPIEELIKRSELEKLLKTNNFKIINHDAAIYKPYTIDLIENHYKKPFIFARKISEYFESKKLFPGFGLFQIIIAKY